MESRKIFFWILSVIIGITLATMLLNTCSDTAGVVHKEFGLSALLKKYEYFKDLSAAIDSKRAEIEVYRSVLEETDDRSSFEYNQSRSELLGLISMHNSLCKEYNAGMSKFNYSFCNTGTLPETNLTPLPREIKPYIFSIH